MAPTTMTLCIIASLGLLVRAFAGEATASHSERSIAGVQKVIDMLNKMTATAKKEKNDEEIAFAKFTTWCTQETASLDQEIKKNGEDIELYGSEIGKLESDTKALGESIGKLSSDVASFQAEVKSQTAQRETDHAAYLEESQDYAESVDALDRAISVMQKQDYDRPALLQMSEKDSLPAKAKSLIVAFVGMMDGKKADPTDYQAPEANAYEFQSGSIVDLLKKLKAEFTKKLGTCQKEEMNAKHAFDMIVEDLKDSIENSEKETEAQTAEKEAKDEKSAELKKLLESTTTDKAANEATLKATATECAEKKLSFAEKQQLRTEELEAIAKAIEILSSPEVSGNAEKYLSLAQHKQAAAALVQMSDRQASGVDRSRGVHRRVREFLATEGQRLHSQQLALLAEKLLADPFAKVKKLIDDMITRLLEEANEDANHEGFCDKEMGKSKIARTKLTEDIDALDAEVEEGQATIAKLGGTIAMLVKEVAELVESVNQATDLRKEEKAKNELTVKDAEAAQKAVAAATAVLKDFYEKASTATALVQSPSKRNWGLKGGVKMGTDEWKALANPDFKGTVGGNYDGALDTGHKEGMQTFGETYEGQQDENQYGVLALLEVIQSDFANLKADTEAAEAAAQKGYETFVTESEKNKAVKERNIEMNTADKATAEGKLQEDIADLKSTQDELLAAERYYKKLEPQCIDQGMTWDERVEARKAEIESLKMALKILSSEDIATSAL